MFTNDAQKAIDAGKDIAVTRHDAALTLTALATALAADRNARPLLAACLMIDTHRVLQLFPTPDELLRCSTKLPLADDVRKMLGVAKELVQSTPSGSHPSLISLPHLVSAVALSLPAAVDGGPTTLARDDAHIAQLLAGWIEKENVPPSLGDLTQRLRALRQELLQQVRGQDHAVHQFVDGLFNVDVVAAAESSRRKPAGLFVFAGPPGVGKTFLAELGASHLNRPFKRFDMSTYAHAHESSALAGSPRVYHGAQPGTLTDFVQHNPNAVVLFDEIERAHASAIQLFLQVLDAGRLQDKHTEQDVEFRDTILIFTTNVGRSLYENENTAGVHQANAAFHRSTILDALRTEVDPRTRTTFFPSAICSRMATGYPVLFNHLRVEDLAQISRSELSRVASLLERQHGQRYTVADEIPLALVMREGTHRDARTVKAQAEAFLKEEVFKACQLFEDEHVDEALRSIKAISVEVDREHAGEVAQRLFWEDVRPVVLFSGDPLLGRVYSDLVPTVEWCVAANGDQVFDVLAKQSVDFVLLDLTMPSRPPLDYADLNAVFHDVSGPGAPRTELHFDHAPLASRRYATGQRLLEQLHSRMPDVPVFLFSTGGDAASGTVDDELLLACVRAGGARGVIRASLDTRQATALEAHNRALRAEITRVATRLRREKSAAALANQNQVVTFDTAPVMSEDRDRLRIRCRNFRLTRAIHSTDASGLLKDLERPTTRFDDIVGAKGAKDALKFIRDWLTDPKKYAAAGVEPPRGALLTGSPGTGKTMLARALAGESDCAFVSEAATNFVTKFQGSGPEAIRELFARARRYAPSVVFIDEIDAIGANRSDVKVGFVGHGESMALNQLLVEMDGFTGAVAKPVIVIAATNRPEVLDPALLRRFSRTIEVELPTRAEREVYLHRRLDAKASHQVSQQVIERLAAQGQGLSIADLDRILAQAGVAALSNRGVIDDAILSEAFETVLMGEAKEGTDVVRTARHEAGHAVIMCATGRPPVYVTVVGRGSFGGYAAFEDREERRSRTKHDLEDLICQLVGGREAERLYYGDEDGASTGPSNDLERATKAAESMVYEYGMSEDIGFVRIDRRLPLHGDLAARCHAAVRKIMEAQIARAGGMLAEHRKGLDGVSQALVERGRLLRHEVMDLVQIPTPVNRE